MTTDPTVHFCGLTHCEGPSHTWVNGAKAYTCHGPNTERRERYAAAIDGVSLYRAADAAMAVADEELEQLRAGWPLSLYYSHEACGFRWHGRDGMDIPMSDGQPVCPRCELEQLYNELTGANLACWEEEQDVRRARVAAANARKRAARLRGEVSAYKRTLAEADQRKQEYKQACIRLRAEVERMKVLVAASETPGHTVRRMADEAQQAHEFVPDTPRAPGLCATCGDSRAWHRADEEQQAEPCPGFPDQCPNLITVSPDLPHHDGGIRCGCNDKEPRS